MEYRRSDSSGTDDDPLPSQPARVSRGGHVSGIERSMSGSGHHRRSSAADQHVRKLEQDAYLGVLRAFRAQSAAITWRKEQVMVTLRQELGITDGEHLEYLNLVNSNDALREHDEHIGTLYAPHVESYPGSLLPGSRKRQRPIHNPQTSPVRLAMKSALSPPSSAPTSIGKRAPPVGGLRRQKSRGGLQQQIGSALGTRVSSLGDLSAVEVMADPWSAGKRSTPRWPEDIAVNEVVTTDYEPKKVPPSDPQFLDMHAVSLSSKEPPRASEILTIGSRGAASKDSIKGGDRSVDLSSAGRGRSASKGLPDSFERPAQGLHSRSWKPPTPENGSDIKGLKQIHVPSLETLIKQVDKIAEEDDLAKVESIRKAAKEHEELLRKALAEIGDSSEGDTDADENRAPLPAHSTEHERDRSGQRSRDQHANVGGDDTAANVEGSDGVRLAGDAP